MCSQVQGTCVWTAEGDRQKLWWTERKDDREMFPMCHPPWTRRHKTANYDYLWMYAWTMEPLQTTVSENCHKLLVLKNFVTNWFTRLHGTHTFICYIINV